MLTNTIRVRGIDDAAMAAPRARDSAGKAPGPIPTLAGHPIAHAGWRTLVLWALCTVITAAASRAATWHSVVCGADLRVTLHESTAPQPQSPPPLVIYLENLPAPRLGTESDAAILARLRSNGYLVAELDYGHASNARWPNLNRDIVALRESILRAGAFAGRAVDLAHVFIIPAGDDLKRDVIYYRGGRRVLGMDIIYPTRPASPVGALIEFSCDNQNRMGDYSLAACSDTLLEGAATEGFAVAMADHPVPPPYKGLDPMPDSAWKIKSAVRTLRAKGKSLGLSGRIIPVGFSRGSGMALMLLTAATHPEFEGHGEHPETDSSVQGGVVLSGRFTYLDLLPNDHMIPRYNAAWGTRAAHEDVWRAEGALDYLNRPTLPLFLSINCSEGQDAQHQMDLLRRRLDALHSSYEFHAETTPRGHKVPLDAAVLDPMLAYLRRRLN